MMSFIEAHRNEYGVEDAYDRTRSDRIVDLVGPTGSLPEWNT